MARFLVNSKDVEEAKAIAKEKIRARNKAMYLIDDAIARYRKEKTRARSKKLAMEKDAVLNDGRFKALDDYERFEDIQEAYGCDYLTEKQRDDLEELWKEREEIKSRTIDGVYVDDVTRALTEACMAVQDMWEDKIEYANNLEKNIYKYIDTDTWEEVAE